MHSGIYELQHQVNERARQRVDHRAIARRSHQVARQQVQSASVNQLDRVGKFARDIAFDFGSAIVLIAVIAVGAMLMGEVMSAEASVVEDPLVVFSPADAPLPGPAQAAIPDVDNGDPNDDPMVVRIPDIGNGDHADDPVIDPIDPGKVQGNPGLVPPVTRDELGLPLTEDESVPGRSYLFAKHGDDNDAPTVSTDGRGHGNPAPLPPVTRDRLGLPLDDDAPGRHYLFAGHGDDDDAPTVD